MKEHLTHGITGTEDEVSYSKMKIKNILNLSKNLCYMSTPDYHRSMPVPMAWNRSILFQ